MITVTTAVFSTCGMGVWTFALAAFFSLPKQFVTVYLGVLLENSSSEYFWMSRDLCEMLMKELCRRDDWSEDCE